MEHLNQSLFLLLNASPSAPTLGIETARVLAEFMIWTVPTGLVIGWLRGSSATREALLAATIAGLTGLLINQLIGLLWYQPRPFAIGIGRTLVTHAPDSSFPSDHLTLIWTVGLSLLLHERTRFAGWMLVLLGLPVAWARIYLGLHFPLDMLGAALVAMGSVWLVREHEQGLIAPLMRQLLPPYRGLFAGMIRRGWVRE